MKKIENKLVVFTVPFTPVLKILKEGCHLENVEFIILHPPKKFRFFVYHFFRILGLNWLAVRIFDPTQFKKIIELKGKNTSVLFWSSHLMSTWMTITKLINPLSKKIFSWGPIEEDSHRNSYFQRKLKRIEKCKKKGFEFYTYNQHDAEKYGMKLTTQVYRKNWNIFNNSIERDFYFIGKSKNRDEIISNLRNILTNKGFVVDFRIFDDLTKEFIPFEENVRLSMGCRCVVDVVAKKYNAGMTLRPLEALFFKKKLLTNDDAVKKCDFYHPNNIFIFDEANINLEKIENFMGKPFHEIERSIIEKYDVNNWLQRYFING